MIGNVDFAEYRKRWLARQHKATKTSWQTCGCNANLQEQIKLHQHILSNNFTGDIIKMLNELTRDDSNHTKKMQLN